MAFKVGNYVEATSGSSKYYDLGERGTIVLDVGGNKSFFVVQFDNPHVNRVMENGYKCYVFKRNLKLAFKSELDEIVGV